MSFIRAYSKKDVQIFTPPMNKYVSLKISKQRSVNNNFIYTLSDLQVIIKSDMIIGEGSATKEE